MVLRPAARAALALLALVAVGGDYLYDVEVPEGALGVELGPNLEIVGFGKAAEYHVLVRGGVAVGDVVVAVDGERLVPAGGPRRGAARRLREARARLEGPADGSRRLSLRRGGAATAPPDAGAATAAIGAGGEVLSIDAEAAAEAATAAPTAAVDAEPWRGTIEVAVGKETIRAPATLAAFGAPPTDCAARPLVLAAERACHPRKIHGADGRYVFAERGGRVPAAFP